MSFSEWTKKKKEEEEKNKKPSSNQTKKTEDKGKTQETASPSPKQEKSFSTWTKEKTGISGTSDHLRGTYTPGTTTQNNATSVVGSRTYASVKRDIDSLTSNRNSLLKTRDKLINNRATAGDPRVRSISSEIADINAQLTDLKAELKELDKTRPVYSNETASQKLDAVTGAENALKQTRKYGTDITTEIERRGKNLSDLEANVQKLAAAYQQDQSESSYNSYIAAYQQYEKAIKDYNTLYGEYKGLVDSYNTAYDDYSYYMDNAKSDASGWKIAGDTVMAGLGSISRAIGSTIDFVLPAELWDEKDPLSKMINDQAKEAEYFNNKWQESLYGRSDLVKGASEIGKATVEALPNAILAMMSGGTSVAAQGTTATLQAAASASTGLASTIGTVANTMVRNPLYWSSVAQTMGPAYEEAKANGANEVQASAVAIIASALNAGVEVSGGIEMLPARLQSGDTNAILQWVLSTPEEGVEEVIQRLVSGSTDKLIYDYDKPIYSTTDENAIINPKEMGKEFAMGTAVAGVLGGAQTGLISAANAAANKQYNSRLANIGSDYASATQELIDEGKSFSPDTEAYRVAQELQSRVDSGEQLTEADLGRAVVANERAIKLEEANNPEQFYAPEAQDARVQAQAQALSEVYSEPDTVPTSNQAARRTAVKPNYGEHGNATFNSIVETNTNADPVELMVRFDTPYQAGLTGLPMKQANLIDAFQIEAYNAGRLDYIANMAKDEKKAPGVVLSEAESGFDHTSAPSDITQEYKDFSNWFAKSLGVKGSWDGKNGEAAYNAFFDKDTGGVTFAQDFGINPSLMKKLGSMDFMQKVDSLSATRDESFIFYVGHEMAGHVAKERAPKQMRAFFNAMYNYKQSQNLDDNLARSKQAFYSSRNVQLDTDSAIEEVGSDSILMLYDGDEQKFMNAMRRVYESLDEDAKQGARTYLDTLKDFIKKLKAWVRKLTGKENAEARANAEKGISELEKLRDMFESAIAESMKAVKEARTTKRDGKLFRTTEADGTVILETSVGNPVAMMTEDGSALFSLKTYEDFGRAELKRWLTLKESKGQITKEESADILKQLDEYYDLCQKFIDKYAPFGAWSNAEVVRDNKGKPVFSVVKANGEYAMNLDFSLVCKKRRTLDAVFKEMIDRGIMDDLSLEEADIAKVNEIIRSNGFETACALCFVDSKRYRQAKVADTFVNQYNDIVRQLLPEDGSVKAHHFDFVESGVYKDRGVGLHTLTNAQLQPGIEKLKQIMRENGKQTVAHKIAKHLLNTPADRKLMSRSDFMNTDGFGAVKLKNPAVLKLYNSSKGAGGPKAAFSDVQYLGEILQKNNFTPERAYAVGGVRIQSFSDYIPRLVFDYLQMVADLSAKKLPAHAYTKEAIFVKQFGMTGIKMNMSLVPAVAEDGVAPGLDKNGDYFWYDGQSFGSDVKIKGSGKTGFELAIKIQNTPGYSQHCGTVAVGVSNEHIMKMLDDDNIRMIIPYHKSSLNHIVAVLNNIDKYTDYTNVQNTRNKSDGKKISGKDFNFNEALRRTGDAKTAANEYLAWCEKNGYIPKFDEFSKHENYYKVLEDFSTYDNGMAAPQGAVTMTFPKEGDAFGSMAELIEQGLEEDAILEADREKSVPRIVDQVEQALKKKDSQKNSESDKKYSLKDSDYLSAVERGDMKTAQKLVDEAAKAAGYATEHLYHGTSGFGFTKLDVSNSDDGISFFATNNIDVAQGYFPYFENDYDDYHDFVREIGKKSDRPRTPLSRNASADAVLAKIKADMPEYKTAKIATEREVMDYINEREIPYAVENAKELQNYSVPNDVRTLVDLVVSASEDGSYNAWKAVADRYQEFENIYDIYYNGMYFAQASMLWGKVQSAVQMINKAINNNPILNNGEIIGKSVLIEKYNYYLAGEGNGIYDLYAKHEGQLFLRGRGRNWNDIPLGEITTEFNDWWVNVKGHEPNIDGQYRSADTRSIAEFAKHKGYRSVCFEDIYDAGVYGSRGDLSTVYTFFYPEEDVKSADPVTYDDNGNVIPLSERFNTENNDIRFSLKGERAMRNEINRIRANGKMAGKTDAQIDSEVAAVVGAEYSQLLKVYGEIKRGERPARDIVVPQRTEKNRHVSQTIRTVLEAEVTPDEAVPTIQELITQGDFSYERITDKAALAEADKTIRYKGFETAMADWLSEVKKGIVSKANTAMGWSLYNAAATKGDLKTAMTILNGMVQHQRSAAQALQATRILKKMSPDAQLYGIQRSVESINEEMRKRHRKNQNDTDNVPVELWMQKTGELLANQLGNAVKQKTRKEKTVCQRVLADLRKLARETVEPAAMPADTRTEMDSIYDMFHNKEQYEKALAAAKETVAKEYGNKPEIMSALEKWMNTAFDYTEQFTKEFTGQTEIKIPAELVDKFLSQTDQDGRDEVTREIYRYIGSQMPSRFIDKWNAWRYLAMLGNPRTHVRNVVGNLGFAPVVAAKNMTAGAIESAVSFVTGGKIERNKGMVNRKLLQAAWADYDNVADEVSVGGKYNDADNHNKYIEEGRTVFKFKPLEKARKGNSAALEAEDIWFARPHYAFALAQYCKAHGVTADQLRRGKALGNARAYAIKEAQKATYKDTNAFSEFISKLGRYHGDNKVAQAASFVTEGILPFRKTPANILVRGLEYSPVGLLKSLTFDLRKVQKGDMTAAEAIDNISAGLTGTGLLGFGLWAAAEGLIRGAGGGDDEEKKFEELQGHQTYALELPNGKSITLDWLAPEVLPMFIGVNLYETATENQGESNLADMLTAVSNVTEPLLEMSCLQSLNDLFDNIGYATSGGLSALPKALVSAATSYLTQAFPTILGQFERSSQDVRMTTYTEKDSFLTSDLQYTLGKISAKIPGWDFNQIPYIDAWGRTESSGSKAANAANNFLNPAYTSQIETSAMEEELQRLYDETGIKGVLPDRAPKYFTVNSERKDLTGEEYVEYATEKGQLSYEMLTDLMNRSEYRGMNDEERAEAVEMTMKYADAIAKTTVSDYEPTGWIADAMNATKYADMDETDYMLFKVALSTVDKQNTSGNVGSIESADKAEAILSFGSFTDKDIAYLWDTKEGYELLDAGIDMSSYVERVGSGHNVNAEKLIDLHNNGVAEETYYDFIDMLKEVDQPTESGKLGSYTQDEATAAIAAMPGLTREERALLWQSVNKSWKPKNNPWR